MGGRGGGVWRWETLNFIHNARDEFLRTLITSEITGGKREVREIIGVRCLHDSEVLHQ